MTGSFSSSSASSSTSSSTFTSSSSSSSSSVLARVHKDGEDYPEEEEYPEYVENSNTDKKNKNSSKIPIIAVETDPLELAAAQAEVKSVDIDGYLLDDEEQTKRCVLTYVCLYVCTYVRIFFTLGFHLHELP